MLKLWRLFKRKPQERHEFYEPGTYLKFYPGRSGRRLLKKIQKDGKG